MESKPPIRISMAFEESILPGSLRVNRICLSHGTGQCLNSVSRQVSVSAVFTKNGASPKYVVLLPMTRLYHQAETFRAAIESEAARAGIQDLVFENPHEALAREWLASLGPDGFEARPPTVVEVAVTREDELFIAGCDKKVRDRSFTFRSRPVSSAADTTAASIETVVSEAFEFIERSLRDPGSTKVLLASDSQGISRCVVNKLHRLLSNINEDLEVSIFRLEAALKGALRQKPNRSRAADQHLREAETALQRGDYRGAYFALEAARQAHPCDAVLSGELDFRKRLRAAAAQETGTQLKRFEASIERDQNRLVKLWQEIAVQSPSESHTAKDAQLIAKFLQGAKGI